mmetsp:Transcript_110902/g.277616  ORF Transcript_110902/g.277616 Transcript_110902/m.277616 type:complete len:346 (+) Transcript_110902:76-1113(+)
MLSQKIINSIPARRHHLQNLLLTEVRLKHAVVPAIYLHHVQVGRLLGTLGQAVCRLRGVHHHVEECADEVGEPGWLDEAAVLLTPIATAHQVEGESALAGECLRGYVAFEPAVHVQVLLLLPFREVFDRHEHYWDVAGGSGSRCNRHVRVGVLVEQLETPRADVTSADAESDALFLVKTQQGARLRAELLGDEPLEVLLENLSLAPPMVLEEAVEVGEATATAITGAVKEFFPGRGHHDLPQRFAPVAHGAERRCLGSCRRAGEALDRIKEACFVETLNRTCVDHALGAAALEDHCLIRLAVPMPLLFVDLVEQRPAHRPLAPIFPDRCEGDFLHVFLRDCGRSG